MFQYKSLYRLLPYFLPSLFIIFGSSCATNEPTPLMPVDANVIDTAVSTLTPSPSHTPLPISPSPTPTVTTMPIQTPIPLPLASMTPFPTVTPNYTAQEPKSIFLLYGNLGGDGGMPIGHYAPSLVIYTDGQSIFLSGERYSRTYLETYLSPSEMCRLQREIEATGFLEPHEFDEYYTQQEGSEGASNVVIQLEDTFYSFYSPDIQYLKDDLHAGYEIIANYQPSEPLKPYTPTYLALMIDKLEPDDGSIPITWPTDLPSITELQPNPEESVILIEGELVVPIFDLFMRQRSSIFFQDGENTYLLFPYPLLPHETPRQFSNYPDRPLDYVSLLNCKGEASFISPAIPTATPTLTSSASKLTGKGRVLFVTDADGDTEIYVMEADGTNRLRLTNNISDDWSPTWSPNGQLIAFASDRDGDSEIFVMSADGTGIIQLTYNETGDYAPSWAPDGSKIVFVSDKDKGWQQSEIYMMNSDGSQQQRLTDNNNDDLAPKWSEDGRQIAFMQEVEPNKIYQLVTLDISQTNIPEVKLPFSHEYGLIPAWSPNGLLFATANSSENGEWAIRIMNGDLNTIQTFNIPIEYPGQLNWSNDGKFILFSGYGTTRYRDIFALDVENGELIQLTFMQQDEYAPSLWP